MLNAPIHWVYEVKVDAERTITLLFHIILISIFPIIFSLFSYFRHFFPFSYYFSHFALANQGVRSNMLGSLPRKQSLNLLDSPTRGSRVLIRMTSGPFHYAFYSVVQMPSLSD